MPMNSPMSRDWEVEGRHRILQEDLPVTRGKGSSWKKIIRHHPLGLFGLLILIVVGFAAIAPHYFTPYDPLKQDLRARLSPPTLEHPFGTDELGRDILSRIVYGARISLGIAVGANLIAGIIGIAVGTLAGYYGGLIEFLGMRPVDVFLAFPGILLAIAIVAVLGPGLVNITISVALFSFPIYARVSHSVAISLRGKEFVLAARSIGATNTRIVISHILRNAMGSLSVVLVVRFADSLLTASSLSFLGLGAPPYIPEWGTMLSNARPHMLQNPHVVMFPGLAIAITVMASNLVGQMLTDYADPFKDKR
jgi:peptide/nickel transport system permease protein